MPAVRDSPPAVGAESFGPGEQVEMIRGAGSQGALAELAAQFIDGNNGMAVLVGVHAEYDHGPVLLCQKGNRDRSVGTPQLGRRHAPIKPRRPVQRVEGRTSGPGRDGRRWWSEPPTR